MTTRAFLPIGLMLMAIAGVWIAVQDGGGRPPASDPASDAELRQMPPGPPVTLQFFRNPSPVAAVTMETLDGRTISTSEWRDKVTIVNFWATWCGPCRAEIPDLVALQDKYRDYVQVIGISQDEAPPRVVEEFAEAHGVNYPIVMATPEISAAFPGINALPTSYLIDRQGRIVQRHVGMLIAERTEAETRVLAGLPVNAVVEQIDPVLRMELGDGAEIAEIPGLDLASVAPERRGELLQRLNNDNCTCGCQLSIAKCRVDDPTCGVSLPIARQIVQSFADAGK
jgi:thiol-disulfide isomerase/thioredoxin